MRFFRLLIDAETDGRAIVVGAEGGLHDGREQHEGEFPDLARVLRGGLTHGLFGYLGTLGFMAASSLVCHLSLKNIFCV